MLNCDCIFISSGLLFDMYFFYQSGKICGDTFQKSFLEWTFAQHEVESFCGVQPFKCPACCPSMHAISVDGNRKLYRFSNAPGYVCTDCYLYIWFIFVVYYTFTIFLHDMPFFSIQLRLEKGYFDGMFIAEDEHVSSFVEHVHEKTKHVIPPLLSDFNYTASPILHVVIFWLDELI